MKKFSKEIIKAGLYVFVRTWGKVSARNYKIENTIIISCSPRGGSTWIAEVLQRIPGYLMLWEPFHPTRNPESVRLGLSSHTYIPHNAVDKEKSDYIFRLLTGRALTPNLIKARQIKFNQIIEFKGYLAKILVGRRFLRWTLNQYNIPVIFLLRHPCAVVASQLRHYAWSSKFDGNPGDLSEELKRDYPHLVPIHASIKSKEEKLAFIWALDTFIPLQSPKPHPWFLTTYELLVTDGDRVLHDMFNYLGKPIPPEAIEQLDVASATTETNSPFAQGKSALDGWKKSLTTTQIEDILRITNEVGIGFYSDEIHPDYKQLGLSL